MGIFKLGRYAALATLLMVLAAGVGTALAFNYSFANHTAATLATLRTVGEQRLQPRVVTASLHLMKNDLAGRRYLGRGMNDLRTEVQSFEGALAQLDAVVTSAARSSSALNSTPLAAPRQQRALRDLRQAWGELNQHLKPVVGFAGTPYVETAERGTQLSNAGLKLNTALEEAVRFAQGKQEEMTGLLDSLAGALQADVQARSAAQRTVIAATAGVTLVLLAFTFVLLSRTKKHEVATTRAKKETDDILRTVNQGLFLLDHDLKVGSERSEALERIFRRKDFDHQTFESLLRGIVPDKILETALEYVKLMWGERVNEKLIKTINPLGEVEVHFDTGSGPVETQYLEFDFNRVRSEGNLTRLLVTVIDVTRRVELAKELQESQEKAQAQLDLLLHILHVEPRQLTAFLEESEVAMKMVNSILKEPAREEAAFRAKLDGIFRQIHSVKGEAAALGLQTVESRAHGFEEALAELRNRTSLSGNDFLPLVVKLDDLFGHLAQVRDMVGRLADLRTAMSTDGAADNSAQLGEDSGPEGTMVQPGAALIARRSEAAEASTNLESNLRTLAERIANEQAKKVKLTSTGLDEVPKEYRRAIKDISIQLVRNGVAHGIERPHERQAASKPAVGNITLRFESRGNEGYEFICQDDGRGLSADKLRETAVKKGLLTAEQAAKLDDRRALSLIFMAGFSTQGEVTKDAGRGVGMDIVRNLIQELGGKVGVSTTAGRFARFRIWLPASARSAAAA